MVTNTTAPQLQARMAGTLYLIIIVLGVCSEALVRSSLIVPGDAAATAGNILANEGLFRLGFAADTVMAMSDVALAILLFVLLRPVSPTLALMAAAFRLIQTAILGVNLLNHHAALLILTGTSGGGFDSAQLEALAQLSLAIHGHGYDLGLLFFGINSLLVGWLVFRSGFLPKALGVLMAGAGLVYLAGGYLLFLAPAAAEPFAVAYALPLIAESALCLWLVARGVNTGGWQRHAAGPAAA